MMLGKLLLSRPRSLGCYESFSNEDYCECKDAKIAVSELVGSKTLATEDDFNLGALEKCIDDDSSIYYLPPPASASVCLPPNPDPPPFDALAEPLTIEMKQTPSKMHSMGAVLDPFYADSLKLQEEILSPGGVEIYVSASDLLENVAVIELKSNLWIGGWNQRVLNLHGHFHLGDMLVSINGYNIHSLRDFTRAVKETKRWALKELNSDNVKCRLRLRRLPLAKTLIVPRQVQDQQIGINFDDNGSNKVKSIDPEGPLACSGLPPLAMSFLKRTPAKGPSLISAPLFLVKKRAASRPIELVPWTATEINHRLLNPFFVKHEADLLIGARGMEISVTFQPSDFVDALCRKLRKINQYRAFF